MTVTSNLYAEKVYAEHPNALYALDESADYVSWITDAQRTISTGNGWTLSGITSTNEFTGTFPVAQLDSIVNELVLPDLGSPPTTLVSTNLVSNSNFETSLSGWSGYLSGTISRVSSDKYSGSYSMQVIAPNFDDGVTYARIAVVSGQTYTISAWVKSPEVGAQLKIYSQFWTASTGGSPAGGGYSYENVTGDWQRLTRTYTATGSWLEVRIANEVGASQTFLVDNVLVEQSSSLGDYFDGSTISGTEEGEYVYAWTGTANLSTSTKSVIGAPPSQTSIATSPVLTSGPNIDNDSGSFALSLYVFPFDKKVTVELGYSYTDTITSTTVTNLRSFYIVDVQQWQFISETFNTPTNFSNLKAIVKITYNGPSGPPTFPSSYSILIHGLTVGQKSEQFNVESLGNVPVAIPSSITPAISGYGVELNKYGLQTVSGYYMSDGYQLSAINCGMPMVYGASNSTRIIPRNNGDDPSLVIPGENFFSQSGRYNDMTAEFWIRINANTIIPRKIFGPVTTDDGLYVHDSFVSLKLNKNIGTYYISEWDRPMLMQIRVLPESASLIINGEEVISLTFESSSVVFANKYDENGKDQDWLGFYAHQDVPFLEIDAVAIYSYAVPNIVAKRRWVFGQGVEPIQNSVGSDVSDTVMIDYSVANYSKNYLYPDIGRWQQGINENLLVEDNVLSTLRYSLPEVKLSNNANTQWYEDNESEQGTEEPFIALRPNSSWDTVAGYLSFPTINTLSQDLKAFYLLVRTDADNANKQTMMHIENSTTGDFINVYLQDQTVTYSFTTSDGAYIDETLYSYTDHIPGTYLAVGIDIDKFISSFDGRLVQFFGSKQNLEFYVGGNKNLDPDAVFSGKIYRIGFCTSRNLKKISTFFIENGVMIGYTAAEAVLVKDAGDKNFGNTDDYVYTDPETGQESFYWEESIDAGDEYFGNAVVAFTDVLDGGSPYNILSDVLFAHTASYTLVPKMFLGKFFIDIATNGYWQDYLPVSYFTKYVVDGNNNKYQDVDFLQFNISYPQIARYVENISDFDNICIRTYVSFQYLKNSATIDPESYPQEDHTGLIDGVIEPGLDWESTLYEISDETIIYFPPNVDLNTIGIVLHLEIISNGIIENPIKITSLQLASQSLNGFRPNPVGTKLGTDIYPYRKSAEYFDYKGRNPYTIYKGSSSYFYLTSKSGMMLSRSDSINFDRGISIPINKNASNYHKVSAMQIALRWPDISFSSDPVEIFEIKSTYQHIKVYLDADGYGKERGRIYAINAFTGEKQDGVTFYINGRLVLNGMIYGKTWSVIGISFSSPLNFENEIGAFRITGSIMFNNVSFYQITEQQESSNFSYKKWFNVSSIDGIGKDWAYWKNLQVIPGQYYTWRDVLFVASERIIQVSPLNVYKKYTGTDRFVIDTDNIFSISGYKYAFYNNVEWKSAVIKPV